MNIVFIDGKNNNVINKLIEELCKLGQEVIIYPNKKISLIPIKLRIGDIYFYDEKKTPTFLMKIISFLLNKPVIALGKMPPLRFASEEQAKESVFAFEKKCYREYAKFFKSHS